MTRPTVAGLAGSAMDPMALHDSLTGVDRPPLTGGLATQVVEVVEQ